MMRRYLGTKSGSTQKHGCFRRRPNREFFIVFSSIRRTQRLPALFFSLLLYLSRNARIADKRRAGGRYHSMCRFSQVLAFSFRCRILVSLLILTTRLCQSC
jgi:hypothetical protein